MREQLRTEQALRLMVAVACGETPFFVDRALDNVKAWDDRYRSDGLFHRLPMEKVHRVI